MKTRVRPMIEPLEGRELLTAGVLDTTFGGTGYVLTQIGKDTQNSSQAVAVQPNLAVVVVGSTTYTTGGHHTAIERFTPGGGLDPSFGTNGVVNLPFTTSIYGDVPYGVAIQPDGDIVVIAKVNESVISHGVNNPTGSYWGIARLLPNGTPDRTFGTAGNGIVLTMFSASANQPESVALQPNGQIVVEGFATGSTLALTRLNPNGSIDTAFGNGGRVFNPAVSVTTNSNGTQSDLAIDSSGRIAVAGYTGPLSSARMVVVRYNPDGTPDGTFGTGGMVSVSSAGFSYVIGDSLALQSNGDIVVDGTGVPTAAGAPNRPLILARFTPGGSLDTTFGTAGFFVENRLAVAQWSSVTVQGDDKIVVLARTPLNVPSPMMSVTRVLANGSSTDASFGSAGLATLPLPNSYNNIPGGVVVAPDGKIVVTGNHIPATGPSSFAVARFLGDPLPSGSAAITAEGAPTAGQPDPTLLPLVLGDTDFLETLANHKRRRVS
jgi:uncharacterized delta-60 repeat protein